MFHAVRRPGQRQPATPTSAGSHRDAERQQHPGNGRVHPGGVQFALLPHRRPPAVGQRSLPNRATRSCASTPNAASGIRARARYPTCRSAVKNTAITVIASRSSTIASASRNVRRPAGRWVDTTASTANENAISVAIGIAQPRLVPEAAFTARNNSAGTTIPPRAAATGTAARLGSRRSPTTNSRLSSRPARKKNKANSPSAAHSWRLRCRAGGPTSSSRRQRSTSGQQASSPTPWPAPRRRSAAFRPASRCAAPPRSAGSRATIRGRTRRAGQRTPGTRLYLSPGRVRRIGRPDRAAHPSLIVEAHPRPRHGRPARSQVSYRRAA